MKRTIASTCALAIAVGGCSSAGTGFDSARTLVPQAVPYATASHKRSGVRLVFRVPRKHHRSQSGSPRYISPSTQSMVVVAQPPSGAATSGFTDVAPSSPNCTTALLKPLICTVTISLAPGPYMLTISAYDAAQTGTANPQGNLLSTTSLTTTVVTGATNSIGATLDGIPASVGVAPAPSQANLIGNDSTGLRMLGATSSSVLVAAYDADGNLIVGPGAPALSLTVQNATAAISTAQKPGSNPNAFTLSSGGLGNATLIATATPASGAPVNEQVAVVAVATTSFVAGQVGTLGKNDGTGTGAQFYYPENLAYDPDNGNLYVTDEYNCTIRQIAAGGVVTTIAGVAGSCDHLSNDLNNPEGITYDRDDHSLYVSDEANCTIDRVAVVGGGFTRIVGIAGTCSPNAGDLDHPDGIVYAGNNTLYVADYSSCTIKKITGIDVSPGITTIAGSPSACDSNGSDLYEPAALTYDGSGALYLGDDGSCEIRKVTLAGVVTTIAGNPNVCQDVDGTGSAAAFFNTQDITYDTADGALYVADGGGCTIRRVTTAGVVTTIAGVQGNCSYQEGTLAVPALIDQPYGIVYVPAATGPGSLYFSDTYDMVVRQMQL